MIPEQLLQYAREVMPATDELGMTAGLYTLFDDLGLGASPDTLLNIAAMALLFAEIQQEKAAEKLGSRFDAMAEAAKKKEIIRGLAPLTLHRVPVFVDEIDKEPAAAA